MANLNPNKPVPKSKKVQQSKSSHQNLTYNQLQAELDQIVVALGNDETDIDEALELFKRGSELVESLKARLELANNTVSSLQQAKTATEL